MNAAPISPEERDLHLYDVLRAPAGEAARLRLLGSHPASRALRVTLFRLIAGLEAVVAFPLPELRTIHGCGEPTPESLAGLNVLLEQAKDLRRVISDADGEAIRAFARKAGSDLLEHFEESCRAALERLADLESLLVLFGAGTDDDADAGMRILGEMPSHRAGPSVELDL